MTVSRRCDQVTRTPEGTLLRCAATMVLALLSTALISSVRGAKLWITWTRGVLLVPRTLFLLSLERQLATVGSSSTHNSQTVWLLFNRTCFYVLHTCTFRVVAMPVCRSWRLVGVRRLLPAEGYHLSNGVFPLETSIFLEMIPLKEKVFA